MAFKKMNLYKNQSMMPADQCVYTKNNNTNVSNYYEDIHEAQHIMYHNMTAIPTYHRPIIKVRLNHLNTYCLDQTVVGGY